jgi:hypothetical protein
MQNKNRVVVFDIFSGIWPHTLLLNKVIGQLDPNKFEVVHVSCGSLFEKFCTVMESRKKTLDPNVNLSKLDCLDCNFSAKTSSFFISSKGLSKQSNALRLSDFWSKELEAIADSEIISIINGEYDENYLLNGVPIVKFALYETIIKFKKLDLEFSPDEKSYLDSQISNNVRAQLATKEFFASDSQFDIALFHSPEYGANNTISSVANSIGIASYSIRGSSNLSEMNTSAMIWRWDYKPETQPAFRNWEKSKDLSITNEELRRAQAHVEQLKIGKSPFVYSAAQKQNTLSTDALSVLGVPSGKRVVVLSLSSTDETVASKIIGRGHKTNFPGTVFESQFDWVKTTVDWASKRSDVTLIIRLHPRDLPNKRDPLESRQHSIWMELLSNLPKNCILNHPNQRIPFADICRVSDVLVTGWSSTALEALMMGVPVVTYDQSLPEFPVSLQLSGSTKNEYFSNLDIALLQGASQRGVLKINAERWLVHSLVRGAVRLSGRLFESIRTSGPTWARKVFTGIEIYGFYFWRPLELFLTFRKSKESARVNQIFAKGLPDLYS